MQYACGGSGFGINAAHTSPVALDVDVQAVFASRVLLLRGLPSCRLEQTLLCVPWTHCALALGAVRLQVQSQF